MTCLKNIENIKKIAQMLNVTLFENFVNKDKMKKSNGYIYQITEKGLIKRKADLDYWDWEDASDDLGSFLYGEWTVSVRIPWKPKDGTEYWHVTKERKFGHSIWKSSDEDQERYDTGNCFLSRNNAEKCVIEFYYEPIHLFDNLK